MALLGIFLAAQAAQAGEFRAPRLRGGSLFGVTFGTAEGHQQTRPDSGYQIEPLPLIMVGGTFGVQIDERWSVSLRGTSGFFPFRAHLAASVVGEYNLTRDWSAGLGAGAAHMSESHLNFCFNTSGACPRGGPFVWTGITFPAFITYTFPTERRRRFGITVEMAPGFDPLRPRETSVRGTLNMSVVWR